MHRRLGTFLVPIFVSALVLASCSSDDDGDGTSVGSTASLLGEIPASANTDPANIMIVAGDVDRAAELAGVKPWEADTTTDEMLENITLLTGIPRDDKPVTVSMLLPEVVAPNKVIRNDEIRDELGWSVVNVNSFIEIQSLPYRFAVLRADVSADDIEAAVGSNDDGIWSLGGEDLEQDFSDITPARPIGDSLRMALEDGLLVVSRTTPPVRAWLDGVDATMADNPALTAIANALDDADTYSSMMVVNDFSIVAALGGQGTPEQIERLLSETDLINPFDALGVGLSVIDDEAIGSFVYHYTSDDDAKAAVDTVRAVFESGTSLVTREPISELLELRDVTADGNVVVATVGFGDTRPGIMWRMVFQRDLPTAHG